MASKKPIKKPADKVTKKVFVSSTGSKYEVTYINGRPFTAQCVYSSSGLIPLNQPFELVENQLEGYLNLNVWNEDN